MIVGLRFLTWSASVYDFSIPTKRETWTAQGETAFIKKGKIKNVKMKYGKKVMEK